MEDILVVSDNINCFFTNSVCNELNKGGLTHDKLGIGDEGVSLFLENAKLVLAVLSDDFDVRSPFVSSFKKKCSENNKSVVFFGGNDKLNDIRRVFISTMIADEFVRPMEYDEMIKRLKNILNGGESKDKRKHILVVDDSGPMLRTIMGWLEGKYIVSLANSAAAARNVIDKDKPDLILLDYEMPICNGPQFLKRLRDDSMTRDIPVIFLTAQSDSDSVKSVLSLKPQGYILKSTSGTTVLEKVDAFFNSL